MKKERERKNVTGKQRWGGKCFLTWLSVLPLYLDYSNPYPALAAEKKNRNLRNYNLQNAAGHMAFFDLQLGDPGKAMFYLINPLVPNLAVPGVPRREDLELFEMELVLFADRVRGFEYLGVASFQKEKLGRNKGIKKDLGPFSCQFSSNLFSITVKRDGFQEEWQKIQNY